MPNLVLKETPRYECLVEASQSLPNMDASATESYLHLMRACHEVTRIMNSHFTAHGISQGRFLILMLLFRGEKGNCDKVNTPADLADKAQVSRATITGLLDTLEKDKMIRRTPAPEDRRKIIIELTPEGHAFMTQILPDHFQTINHINQNLTETERRTLSKLLEKVAARCQEL
jgi:DNA-binding MarR family transcriptional regulator